MGMKRITNHTIRQLQAFARRTALPLLLLAACGMASCLDETLISSGGGTAATADDADMYMSINVPRTYASGGAYDKETAVETLDVLVFARGEAEPDKYFVHAACKGTLTANANKFQVVMPVGKGFLVHVFINCHDDVVAKGFYNSRGMEMNAMLSLLTTGANANAAGATSLPMHGYITNVDIDKTKVNTTIEVPVLRAVAAAQVMTNVSVQDGELVPGQVADDETGLQNFELREFYSYFYPDSGRVAPLQEAYTPLLPDGKDETRDVIAPSFPTDHHVSDTRLDEEDKPDPYSIVSPTAVGKLGTFYLYENKPWSDTGFDQPPLNGEMVGTTRLVVGGVYNNEKDKDGNPKVTYYRVDFADSDNHLTAILRNHKYTFSIDRVSGSGYDTPDEAALGVPINIYVRIIDWTDELEHVDFDRQNHFFSETKYIALHRDANSARSITVESDVPVDEWKLSFKTETNGTATLAADGFTIENSRYRVAKSVDGKSLVFTALKAYDDLPTGQSRDETLLIKVRELNITYIISQIPHSSDDWGNGGDLDTDLGEDPKNGTLINGLY